MKKKYTGYFFALSIIYQHVAGKYSYCTWMGKKNEEIATALGISIETVKTQKKRAIQSIKEQMGNMLLLASFM